MESLKNYPWPGNIRELQNVIERAIINTEGKYIDISGFESPNQLKSKTKILAEVERNHIISILDETDWVIEGKKGAAAILGINPSTLRGRMRKYSIQRPGNVTKF
jgi:transcriptional regulator of acetoin/glycerol metabolism